MPDEKPNALLFMSGGVGEMYLDNAINALNREFGGVMSCLCELGVAEKEISEVRGRFLTVE